MPKIQLINVLMNYRINKESELKQMSQYKGTSVIIVDTVSENKYPKLSFNKGDYNASTFVAFLRKNGTTISLNNTTVRLYISKPDATNVFLDCDISDSTSGEVTVNLTTNALAAGGYCDCEFHLRNLTTGEVAISKKFRYYVEPSLATDEAVESTNEFQSLTDIIVRGNEAIDEINTNADNADQATINANNAATAANNAAVAANSAAQKAATDLTAMQTSVDNTNTRLDNLVANTGSSNTEITDGRLGADGTTRANIGTLIREIHGKQLDTAKATQTIQQGYNVLNSSNPSPLIPEVQGRTLVNLLGVTSLESSRYYVFLPHKNTTKIIVAGTTSEGVTTITGQTSISYLLKQDFQRKVAASVVKNGHKAYRNGVATTVINPSSHTVELTNSTSPPATGTTYDHLMKLDSKLLSQTASVSGAIPQTLFSFDVIKALTDKYGSQIWQGKTLLADKITLAKTLITKIWFNWYGYGVCPTGNKANSAIWYATGSAWEGIASHTNNTSTKTNAGGTSVSRWIDANGFVHLVSYTDASDGSTVSAIYTDYIDLELTVNTTLPILEDTLYEVTQTNYNKINVDAEYTGTKLLDKYPYVQSVRSLQPYLIAEGENLVPPFSDWETNTSATIKGAYEADLNVLSASLRWESPKMQVIQGYNYYCTYAVTDVDMKLSVTWFDAAGVSIAGQGTPTSGGFVTGLMTPPATAKTFTVKTYQSKTGAFNIKNIMINIGTTAKPFVPRNPSYLYANTLLAGVQGVSDALFQDGTEWKVWRKWRQDVTLDGSLGWVNGTTTTTGYKGFYTTGHVPASGATVVATKHTGLPLKSKTSGSVSTMPAADETYSSGAALVLSVSNADSGFVDGYNPTNSEIAAYFNGWKVKTVDGANKPNAWISVVDGTDAPTQTLAYVSSSVNKPANYTPYKANYQLSSPITEVVQVEGNLVVNGLTQVEVGSGIVIREKIVPKLGSTTYYVNNSSGSGSALSKRSGLILAVYKNGIKDTKWTISKYTTTNATYGDYYATLPQVDYDTTAEYTVTYLVLDKHLNTSNPVDVKATYNQSVKDTLDEMLALQSDNASKMSIHDMLIADLYKRVKGAGW